jgi:ribonuclease P protein component
MATRFGFGRDRRIRRRSDFLRIQSEGERASTPHFVLLVTARQLSADCPEPSKAPSRLGVVVTKKVGNAVIRARIKRLCRECFRLWPDLVPDGVDLVVIARQGAGELGLADVRGEWSRARPGLLKRCSAVLSKRTGAPGRPASSSAHRMREGSEK